MSVAEKIMCCFSNNDRFSCAFVQLKGSTEKKDDKNRTDSGSFETKTTFFGFRKL